MNTPENENTSPADSSHRDAEQAERAMRIAEERTQHILESIREAFVSIDAEGIVTYVNSATTKLNNKTFAEIVGKSYRDVWPGTVGTIAEQEYNRALQDLVPIHYERYSPDLNSWIEVNAYPWQGGLNIFFRDITERRQAEEAIRVSEARYKSLVDTALEGILFLDTNAIITYVNRQLVTMLGYDSPEELVGQSAYVLVFSDDISSTQENWEKRTQGVQGQYELRLRRKDNQPWWVITHASIERDAGGLFQGTFTMFTDISERKKALEAIQSKNDEITAIMESITDAFFAVDQNWCFTYVNREAERVLSCQRDEVLGQSLWQVYPGTVGSTFEKEYRRAIQDRIFVSFIEYYPPFDIWFNVRAYPSENGLSVYFRNVNEERRAIEEREHLLAEQQRLLSELQEAALRQRRFVREMLFSLTEGRLRLCDIREELPVSLPMIGSPITLNPTAIRPLRQQVEAAAAKMELPGGRIQDMVTAVGEAGMNAVVHAGGGTGIVCGDAETGRIQVWIEDQGTGIQEESIHRATLEKGFSSAGTLGHGFWMMLRTVDRIHLLTGTKGTTIVLEQDRSIPEPSWLQDQ